MVFCGCLLGDPATHLSQMYSFLLLRVHVSFVDVPVSVSVCVLRIDVYVLCVLCRVSYLYFLFVVVWEVLTSATHAFLSG